MFTKTGKRTHTRPNKVSHLSNVFEEQLLALEGLVTHVAHVGRQLLVHQLDVRHEVGLVVEAAPAVRALVGLLAGVDQHVAVHVVLLGEALLAHRADEDLLVGRLPPLVHALGVPDEGAQGLERGLAGVAQVLTGVQVHAL